MGFTLSLFISITKNIFWLGLLLPHAQAAAV